MTDRGIETGDRVLIHYTMCDASGETIDVLDDGFVESWVNYLNTGEGDNRFVFDALEFETDSARLANMSDRQLDAVASVLKAYPARYILVEGHTDNVQIGAALFDRFPTNWELSAARATAVVRFLQEKGEIEPERLTASGFSYYKPVASNESEEGRKQNRRIEIMLMPVR